MNGLEYAYIGDAFYELLVRTYLIEKGIRQAQNLHKQAIKYTSNKAQEQIVLRLLENDSLTAEEIKYFKHGRNHSSSGRKNVDASTYRHASGFEALLGRLFIEDEKRSREIVKLSLEIIESGVAEDE